MTRKAPPPGARGAILDALPDVVLLLEDGVILDANATAVRELGGDGPLVGRALGDVLAAGEWDRLEVRESQRVRGWAVPEMCRLHFRRADGRVTTSDVRIGHLDGGLMVIAARDAESMTRGEELANRLAHLPTSMDGAQALFDASEPVFRALGWAVAFMEVCDDEATMVRLIAPEDDPVGEYARSILGRRAPLHVTPVVAEVVRTGEPLFLDNIPVTQAGGVREAIRLSESMVRAGAARSAWCPVRSETGLAAVLVAVGRDLTEHDFVALQLFAAQLSASAQLRSLRLETVHRERLAAVGEMAAVLAHEVRNSLGVFFAAVGALSRANPARRSDWASLLNILQDEADRVQRLVTDLLEFSSGSTPVMESVPVGPIVLDVIQAAQHDASFQTAQPTVHVDVAADLLVRTDRVLLHRALLNVVVNAFQHVSSGGAVDVIATSLRSEVCLTISNDGLPIPLAVAKRVFEPFFTTQPTGTGLGLAIVRRVCTDIGSRVDVVPRPDGATFRIMLPRGT